MYLPNSLSPLHIRVIFIWNQCSNAGSLNIWEIKDFLTDKRAAFCFCLMSKTKYICTALYMFYKVVILTFSGHFSDVILYEIQKYQLDYLYSVPRDPRFTFTFCLKGGVGHPSILRLFKEDYI